MSTRCNVVIIKTDKESNNKLYNTMYHHCDGYPSGVGHILQDFLNIVSEISEKDKKDFGYNDVDFFAHYIHNYDKNFEEEGAGLHCQGDIEYLYVINLNNSTITCYNVSFIDYMTEIKHPERCVNYDDLIDNHHDSSGLVSKIYEASFSDEFSKIKY